MPAKRMYTVNPVRVRHTSRMPLQVAHLERREAGLKEQVAQLDKKLNDMQRVYIKGVKSTVESIRAGRAVLGGPGKFNANSGGGEADDAL